MAYSRLATELWCYTVYLNSHHLRYWNLAVVWKDCNCICRDHAGGNEELNSLKPGLTFYGGDHQIQPNTTIRVGHGDKLKVLYM